MLHTRSGTTKTKPVVITDYNKHMLGVDKVDQLTTYYHFLHRSVKWWRKTFFWLVEVVVVNAYVIHIERAKERREKPLTHMRFRQSIISSLSEPQRISCATAIRTRSSSHIHLERLRPGRHFLNKGTKRRDCVVCSDRSPEGTRHLTLFECQTCSDHPALCPSQCFEAYHTQRNYN